MKKNRKHVELHYDSVVEQCGLLTPCLDVFRSPAKQMSGRVLETHRQRTVHPISFY